MAVDMVVEPACIETTVDDIGGLDHVLERLVSQCRLCKVAAIQTGCVQAMPCISMCPQSYWASCYRCLKLRGLCYIQIYTMAAC